MKRILTLFALCFFLGGCATTSLSSLQRRSIEAKELEGNFDDAYKASITVLQDKGFVIKHTDYNSGVIEAETGIKPGFWTNSNTVVTACIETFSKDRIKERVTFMNQYDDGWGTRSSKIIEEPKFLQEIYDAIQKEMFVRKNLNK